MKEKTIIQFIILGLVGYFFVTINFANIQIAFAQNIDMKTNSQSKTIEHISIEKGYELIQSNKENADFIILDVRTPSEFAEGHIYNAFNIDYLSPTFKENLTELDKNKTYVIHCRSGGRSSKALMIMDELGFRNLYDMGGIIGWIKKGYPVTGQNPASSK